MRMLLNKLQEPQKSAEDNETEGVAVMLKAELRVRDSTSAPASSVSTTNQQNLGGIGIDSTGTTDIAARSLTQEPR
jgi:hypothetical protein